MLWQVIIPQENENEAPSAMTVDAENWYSALKNGLDKQGMRLSPITSLNCSISKKSGFLVEDTNSNIVYEVRPSNGDGPPEEVLASDAEPEEPAEQESVSTQKKEETVLELSAPAEKELPAPAEEVEPAPAEEVAPEPADEKKKTRDSVQIKHEIMFSKDEPADDGSGIYYRERLISVPENTSKEAAGRLIMEYYDQLKETGSLDGNKLFISIQIYDHEFVDQALKPAVAALTWKEWTPKKPQILFPLSGDRGVTFSKLPPPPSAEEVESHKARRSSRSASRDPEKSVIVAHAIRLNGKVKEADPEPVDPTPETQPLELSREIKKTEPSRSAEPAEPTTKEGTDSQGAEDKMVLAFERMQDIFDVRDHDGAAEFALSLARELIKCEAGSCMLISPGKYELYVSAAQGPTAGVLRGRKLSLTEGIVGFATRTGVVVRVPDAQSDPRFNDEIDKETGFTTKEIICAPIQHEGRIRGAIELVNSGEADGFSQQDVDVLFYISGALAEYIDTALPSRQADFSDKEFLERARPRTGRGGKKQASKKKPVPGARSETKNSRSEKIESSDKKDISTARAGSTASSGEGSGGAKDKNTSGKRKKNKKKKKRKK